MSDIMDSHFEHEIVLNLICNVFNSFNNAVIRYGKDMTL